jgi:hypothetical protein
MSNRQARHAPFRYDLPVKRFKRVRREGNLGPRTRADLDAFVRRDKARAMTNGEQGRATDIAIRVRNRRRRENAP